MLEQGLPQHRDVGGVRLVLQRRDYAAGDGGDVGVAAPASDGEAVRHLDQMPVRIGERVLVIAHRRPRHRFLKNLRRSIAALGCRAWTSSGTGGHICPVTLTRAVTRHPFAVARHHRRPPIGLMSRYRWSAAAKTPRSCRSAGSNNPHAMSASTSLRRNWTLTHERPRLWRSR